MRTNDLEHAKADLAMIKEIAGITDLPRREDITTSFLIGAAGLWCGLWALLAPGAWHVWGLLSLVAPVAHVVRVRLRNGAPQGGSPQVRAEFAESLWTLLLAIPFCGYGYWALQMRIPPKLVLATAVFFAGTLMVSGVVGTGRRFDVLPYCVVFMVGALALPATSLSPVLVLGLMLAAAGLLSAGWLKWKLASSEGHGLTD